jgi:hypothetical protein
VVGARVGPLANAPNARSRPLPHAPTPKRDESNREVLRLRKQLEAWKEKAGLVTAEARAAADLRDVDNRRPTPGPDGAEAHPDAPAAGAAAAGAAARFGPAVAASVGSAAAGDDGSCAGGAGSGGGWSDGPATEEPEQE